MLVDVRGGSRPTGLGVYARSLLRELARLQPESITPICWRSEVPALQALGLRPWAPWAPRLTKFRRLPDADVIHGTGYVVLPHRRAAPVVTVHDLIFARFPEYVPPADRASLDEAFRRYAGEGIFFICDSETTRADLMAMYDVAAERCRTIHLGLRQDFFAEPVRERIDSVRAAYGLERSFVLYVGNFVPSKDVPTLLEAWRCAVDAGHELDLVLVGDLDATWHSDVPRVRGWLDANTVSKGEVHLLNYVPDETIVNLYRAATVYATASRWEGFGLPVAEALAAGVPVVAARSGSIPEIAGSVPYYGEPGDASSLANALVEALTDRAVDERIRAGQELARRYSWQRTAAETMTVYRAVAGRRP